MQIVFHIGAHCTDDERLLKTLLKNNEVFAAEGIAVPGPGKYRNLLRDTMQNLKGQVPAPNTRDILLDAILDDAPAERMVLSNSNFICIPGRIFRDSQFYPQAGQRAQTFASIFPNDQLELFMGLRNLATFVPAAFRATKHDDFPTFLNNTPMEELRWSNVVARIKEAVPNASLTIWCNEDTPLIWAQLVREISGVDPLTKITGGFDLMSAIMSNEGMQRFLSYIKSHPPQSENQKRRIMAAFMDKYAIDDEVEEEVDLPGWTDEVMDFLTEIYEEDIDIIQSMPGVTVITP